MSTELLTRVVHCKKEDYDVYIGRPSRWGNPYSHLAHSAARFHAASRGDAIILYEKWLLDHPDLLKRLPELKGKRLGCWCRPAEGFRGRLLCHGQILAALADGLTDPRDVP
jgi:hypothetical protein